jgi:alpha-mannosidase
MHTLFVVSHTHWDREWHEPFQIFRLRLVKCIDKLLHIFATDPDYRYFLLDGQTIVLEDYLEVRPDHEQMLRDLVRAGKLQIGPWYVLPDEFLVSGEALVRNLLRGTHRARDFGDTMRIGYLPDPFGHISQMPQILRGFGIGVAVFRRGLADEPTELWWEASDGARVLACYLRDSYDNAAWLPRDDAGFAEGIEKLRDSLAPHAVTQNLLLMNGTDHMEPRCDLPHLLHRAREQIADAEIVHASLPMYVERVQQEITTRKLALQVAHGELRNPKRHHLLPGVASARMWIKQRNAHAQMLLEKWAEPFAAFAALEVRNLISLAWKYLLQNHPHDSICGCSIDQVHAEMAMRFDWVEQIANQVIQESLTTFAANIGTQASSDAIPLVVFNPIAGPHTDVVVATIEVPGSLEDFILLDGAGNAMPYQILSRYIEEYSIEFIARDVPGHGYRTFYATRNTLYASHHPSPVTRHPSASLRTGPSLALENEFYHVEPNIADGTLTITDKTTGAVFRGVNRFVDGGDRGDLYNYCPPENDTLIAQPSAPPRIEIERGAARQSLRIALSYRLPAQLTDDRSSRAQEMVDENIVVTVSIYPGVRRIDFRVQVDNRARDHRLRVEFPTPIVTTYANADQTFDVMTRSLDLPRDTADWIEQPRPEAPMQSFVSVSDNKIGLTLATRGLPEYEARPHPYPPPLHRRGSEWGTTLALTLLRCIGWLSRDDMAVRVGHAGPAKETPGAQEIGTHVFEYALIPHAGDWRNALAQARAFAAPMRAVATDTHAGTLPPTASFVQASPREFVISALKQAEDGAGLIVRGYNIGNETIDARIVVWRKFARAARVNLNEEEIAPLELRAGREVALRVRAKEIVTVRFE